MKLFLRWRQKLIAEVTPQDVDSYVGNELARRLSKTTIDRRLASLRHLLDFWQERQEDDPAWRNPVQQRRHRTKQGWYQGFSQTVQRRKVAEGLPCCYFPTGRQVACR